MNSNKIELGEYVKHSIWDECEFFIWSSIDSISVDRSVKRFIYTFIMRVMSNGFGIKNSIWDFMRKYMWNNVRNKINE